MKKTNIKSPKPDLTDAQINATKQPFNNILKQYSSLPKVNFITKGWYFGLSGIVLTVLVAAIAIKMYNPSSKLKSEQQNYKTDSINHNSFINEPFAEITIPYQKAELKDNKTQQIVTNTGTRINIPSNCFVDKDNNNVSAPINVLYREFHNPAEIFQSGIPMTYDSAGVKQALESAGMIDIIAVKGKDTLKIAKEKSIQIDLISENSDPKFNVYLLDKEKKNWTYIGKDNVSVKKEKTTNKSDQKVQESTTAIATFQKGKEYVKPIIVTKNKVTFKVEFDIKEFPELSIYKDILFEVDESKNKFNKSWYKINWAKISLKRINMNNEYQVTLAKRDSSVRLNTKAVFSENEYAKAVSAYNTAIKSSEKAQINAKTQLDNVKKQSISASTLAADFKNSISNDKTFYRSFAITQTGTQGCSILKYFCY